MPQSFSDLTRLFEAGDMNPSEFSHRDHVAVAYDMLSAYEFLDACGRYAATIRALAERAGAPMKFNTTITVAFLSLIAERMAMGDYVSFEDFIANNADLESKQMLDSWYSPERLHCDMAREVFLLPNPALPQRNDY
ncbi:MAG: hypothetical protein AAGI06_13780 [Pseudomonadota bacterium]